MNQTYKTIFVTTALALLIGVSGSLPAYAQQSARPAITPMVVVEKVSVKPVQNITPFNARVEAIEAVDVQARVTGFLDAVHFKDGQAIKKDDLLFEIEPDQLNATVKSAGAQLTRTQAARDAAQRTFERNSQLFARNTVSRAVLDDAQAALDIANADIRVAQAALDQAVLNQSYTQVRAPISGNVGRANVTVGNLVGPSSGTLVRIVSLNPIRVAFSMTESLFVTLRQLEAEGKTITADTFKLTLRLANGSEYNQTGRLEFIENEVDPQTGTVIARAIFDNPNLELVPGQFVALSVEQANTPSLPVVPLSAVMQDREGRFVYLLKEDNMAAVQRIKTGTRVGNAWSVTEGLSGGETLVVQGLQRLANGMQVQVVEGQPAEGTQ